MASTYCLTGAFTMVFFYDINLSISFDAILITGLMNLEKLVEKWTEAPSTYSSTEMRECLDGFREILFHHLDEEVSGLMCSDSHWQRQLINVTVRLLTSEEKTWWNIWHWRIWRRFLFKYDLFLILWNNRYSLCSSYFIDISMKSVWNHYIVWLALGNFSTSFTKVGGCRSWNLKTNKSQQYPTLNVLEYCVST